jgi:Rad3-related DNA helicase
MTFIHSKLRPYQQSTLEKIQQSQAKFIIVHAPTGFGKSWLPAQLAAWNHRVLALTRTKSLQKQYVNSYDFTELFGKSNYECLDFDTQQQDELFGVGRQAITADLCTVSKANKSKCKSCCPYPLAREDFLSANAGSLNYSKFLLDRPVVEAFGADYLFLDEAHDLSDLVVDFSGITLNWRSKKLKKYTEPIVINSPQPVAINEGKEFLTSLQWSLAANTPTHPSHGGDRIEYKYWERLKERIEITQEAIRTEPDKWYVYSDNKHFVCKPLTARFHFKMLFDRAPKIVLMSATIGKVDYFTRELGIGDDYEFINVPNVWPAPMRPIEDLKAPKMGFKSTREEWIEHSQIIANRINRCPENWTGLVHSPSKWLTYDLAERLEKMTDRRIFVPDEKWGTEQAAEEWLMIEDDGTICVSWHFWEGIDAGKDSFCCVAKVPFTDFSNPFDKSRFLFDAKSGYGRTANKLVQGLGRIRRGHPEHYGNSKVVCVADSHWMRLKNYISKDVLGAIV